MAVYTLQLPDGRKAKIQATDEASAVAAAKRIPALTGEKGDYQRELTKQRGVNASRRKMDESSLIGGGAGSAFTGAAPLPVLDEIAGGFAAAGNEAVNLYRRGAGKPTVNSRAIYEANRDAQNEYDAETRKLHPVASTAGSLLGGLGKTAAAKVPGLLTGVAEMTRGQAVKRAVLTGGATGGAYGAAEGRTLEERGKNALTGATVGAATGGLLEGVVAPVVGAGVKTGKGVVADVARAARKPDAKKEAERGTASALKILQRKGLSADIIAAERDELAKRGVMAAERAGKDVETQLAMTARRTGDTGDLVTQRVRDRAEGAPDRMMTDLEESLGIDPARAQAGIEEQADLGRALAKEDWDAVDANPAGIMTPRLQEIMQRPSARRAIQEVELSGQDAGIEGSGLALGDVDVPAAPVGPEDLSFAATGAPSEMAVPRGPAEAPSQGPSALTALRNTGEGITSDLAGEAKQSGMRLAAKEGGAELNDMAIRLHELGYTPRVLSEQEMGALLEGGGAAKLRGREADPAAQQRFEARAAAEEFNARGGNADDLPHPEDYGHGDIPPQRPLTEPARMTAPTGESWSKIKRTLDGLVERDPITKRVITHGPAGIRNKRLNTLARDLSEELKAAVPGYREASAKSGEALSIEDAFARGQDLTGKGTEGQFVKAWKSLRDDAERDAFKSGVASNLYELWSQGLLRAGKIKTPRMMGKLELAFGKKEAADMVRRLEEEAKLKASGGRIAPAGGSATYGLNAAEDAAEQAMPLGDLARIGGKAARLDVLGALGDTAMTLARKGEAYGRTAGMSEAARNAYGKVLAMGPDELIPLLREFEKLPPALRRPVQERAEALGLIGGQLAGVGVAGDRPDR